MKICQIVVNWDPTAGGGGIETLLKTVSPILSERNHEVVVITSGKSDKKKLVNGLKMYQINPKNIYLAREFYRKPDFIKPIWHCIDLINLISYFKIKRILKNENPDVVHIHSFKGFSPLVFKAVKKLGIPLVFTAHDFSAMCVRSNLLKKGKIMCETPRIVCNLYRQTNKFLIDNKPDVLIAPSKFMVDKLHANGFFNDIPTKVVHNGALILNGKKTKKDYELIDILYAGALSGHKGTNILIKAFQGLNVDNIRLHIAGKGLDEDKLKGVSREDGRIIFHGFLTSDELQSLYRMANVCVVPSVCYDNSPMVIYESFANSTPVIASRIGGIPELVNDGYNGFLFESGNIDELRSIIKEILDDPSILWKLEGNAFKTAKKYSVKEHVDKLEDIYKGLV
ncbi:glycosyltransferase family 4 protein [Methanothermobacter sp. KEPCO 2]|uniref:glycosyltransferase family 4 protein n=1 Tax=Methanothermobacter TaxID=145260 RepID=UPI0035145E09